MKTSEFNQPVSFKCYPQAHTRADGSNPIYLRVIIERSKREFNPKIYWPSDKFDTVRQSALPRHPNDTDHNAVNLIIEAAKGRANRIKLRYFTDGKHLTLVHKIMSV
jgi:hypothetical protein